MVDYMHVVDTRLPLADTTVCHIWTGISISTSGPYPELTKSAGLDQILGAGPMGRRYLGQHEERTEQYVTAIN